MTLGQDTYYYGRIDSGTKFGVKIGEARSKVKASVDKSLEFSSTAGCESTLKKIIECTGAVESDVFYLDTTFRHGFATILYDADSRVSEIVWDFNMLPVIDF